jgi:hypothetical protein
MVWWLLLGLSGVVTGEQDRGLVQLFIIGGDKNSVKEERISPVAVSHADTRIFS